MGYVKGLKEMKANMSNVSYFSRDKTPMSQKSSKSYIRNAVERQFGAKNYEKLIKKRRGSKTQKYPGSPKAAKNKSYVRNYMETSNGGKSFRQKYSPGNSPTLQKYKKYKNFEKVLRKSPRNSKNKSFTGPRGTRSPKSFY
jgi:hypothetical protein